MAEVTSYRRFLDAHAGLSKSDFLDQVRVPYLYLSGLPEVDVESLFQTLQLVTGRADSSDTPEGPFDPESLANLEPQGVVPVKKDPENNAFSMMITLGRAPNNDVTLPDDRVSKFHVYFRKSGSNWSITDANSTNGTTVDGIRLEPERAYLLRSGACIELSGAVRVMFIEPDELFDLVQYSSALVAAGGWRPSDSAVDA